MTVCGYLLVELSEQNDSSLQHAFVVSGLRKKQEGKKRKLQERDVTTRLEVATPFASNFIATHAPVSDSCVWIAFACVPVGVCVDCVTAHRCFSTYVENTFATRVVLPRSLTTVNLHRANPWQPVVVAAFDLPFARLD